jgi:hypothetical protein
VPALVAQPAASAASRDTPSREVHAAAFLRAHEERLRCAGADSAPDVLLVAAVPSSSPAATALFATPQPAAEEMTAGPALRAQIHALTEMGFSAAQAVRALRLTRGDLERAAELMISGEV